MQKGFGHSPAKFNEFMWPQKPIYIYVWCNNISITAYSPMIVHIYYCYIYICYQRPQDPSMNHFSTYIWDIWVSLLISLQVIFQKYLSIPPSPLCLALSLFAHPFASVIIAKIFAREGSFPLTLCRFNWGAMRNKKK